MTRSQTTGVGGIKIGTELNQTYMIDSLVGVGGMGEVFRGHNIQTGDPVAIKIVLPEFAKDEMILELFRKEARILNHLAHDAIVRYHVFTLDRSIGRPYLAMEFADGPSLAEKLRSGPLSEDDTAFLQTRLADGLYKAHEAGVIHRDMSPDNVILPEGRVKAAKIIDFGIARSANVGGGTLIGGSFAGKYNYVSPEQLGLYDGEVTPKSDIYSLALVLAAALQGRPLEMSGSQVEVVEKRRQVPDLSNLPPRFRDLLTAMLQPDPGQRPASMADVRDWDTTRGTQAAVAPPPVPPIDATVIQKPLVLKKGSSAPPKAKTVAKPAAPALQLVTTPTPDIAAGYGKYLALGSALLAVIVLGVLGGLSFLNGSKQTQVSTSDTQQQTAQTIAEPPAPKPEPTQRVVTPTINESDTQVAEKPPVENQPAEAPPDTPPETTPAETVTEQQPSVKSPPIPMATAAELRALVQGFFGGNCFAAKIHDISTSAASIDVLSNDNAASEKFKTLFAEKAGYAPSIERRTIADNQCAVVAALPRLSSPGALPLKLVMVDEGGDAAIAAKGKVWLKANVSNMGPRNVTVLMVTDDGSVQNISRVCAKCLSMAGDELTITLPLTKAKTANASNAKPVLVVAIASPRNLFSITSQAIYDVNLMVPELIKEIEGAQNVSAAVGYYRF